MPTEPAIPDERTGTTKPTPATARVTDQVDRLTARWAPGTLRWAAGLLWLVNVGWKVPPDFGRSSGGCAQLCRYIQYGADYPVLPGSGWVFEHLISPNLGAFGWMTLLIESTLAVLLISGRYVRFAAVLGIGQSLAIGLSAANAPDEWYWSYLLMMALHLAVLATAPTARRQAASTMAVVTAAYGLAVAAVHAGAGFTGDGNWNLFSGGNDIPDEWVAGTFPGSIAVGLVFVFLGVGGWFVATRADERLRARAGWALVAVSALLLLTRDPGGLVIGFGARPAHLCVAAALGLALAVPGRDHRPKERAER